MAITTVYTLNSIYEIDQERQRARRLQGVEDPTPHQVEYADEDGWIPYLDVRWEGPVLMFVWHFDGVILRRTHTSDVQSLDGPPIRNVFSPPPEA